MSETADIVAVAESPATESRLHLLLLLALATLLFFVGLGALGLTDQDEGRNAEAGREMYESGNWVSPTFNYEPRFAKPAMLYWLMSAAYSMFGVSPFSARFPSAVFGLGLILLQYLFLRRVSGSLIGLLGSLMLLLNVEIVAISRLAITDSVLMFFTTLSLFSFWLGLHGERGARHYMWGFYVGMALATLTKGPVGILIPLVGVVPYLTLTRRWTQFWRQGFPLAGTLLFLVLAVPWYAAMLSIHGSTYTASASADTLGRFLRVLEGHGGTVLFYVPILAFGFFPWSGFLPVAIVQAWKVCRGYRREALGNAKDSGSPSSLPAAPYERTQKELEIFATGWLVVGFVFFSLSATRLPHYIAPLYPAAAILAASYLHRCLTTPRTPGIRASFRVTMVLGYLLGILLASGPALYSTFLDEIMKEYPFANRVDPGLSPVAAGLVLVVGSGLIGYFGLSEARRQRIMWVAGTTIGLVILIGIQVGLPRFHKFFIAPPQELAYVAGENLGPEDRFLMYGRGKASAVFYSKRKTLFFGEGQEQDMAPHLAQPGRTMILLPAKLQSSLPQETEGYTVLLRRHGYLLLGNQPMVESSPHTGASPESRTSPPSFHGIP